MGILYISKEIISKLRKYCHDDLLLEVLEDFGNHFDIVYSNDTTRHPTKFWSITEYISSDTSVSIMNKLQVIFAFINCSGIVELYDTKYMDMGNPIIILKEKGIITEEEIALLNDPWFEHYQNGADVFLTKN